VVLGLWLCYGGIRLAYSTYHHAGGGMVPVYAGRGHNREAVGERWGSERAYKIERYTGSALLIFVGGLFCWGGLKAEIDDR